MHEKLYLELKDVIPSKWLEFYPSDQTERILHNMATLLAVRGVRVMTPHDPVYEPDEEDDEPICAVCGGHLDMILAHAVDLVSDDTRS